MKSGVFLERPNRFIAKVLVDGNIETVHVKNTGRCKELFVEGAVVYLSVADNSQRKTKYDLVCIEKKTDSGVFLVNIDSQIPNDVTEEWLKKNTIFSDKAIVRREVKYKNSRFDFYIEDGDRKIFLEVKGVTLESDGIVLFPDAPTLRGVKHINELIACLEEGYEAYILFVIQMKGVRYFTPNYVTHRDLGTALKNAAEKGVKILAVDCNVTKNSLDIDEFIEVRLED